MSNNPIRIAAVCPTRCWRLAILLYVLGSTVAQTRANSDFPPDDFEVVCLDRATGTLIWRTKPDRLLRPRLILVDDILVAEKNDRRKKEPLGKDRRFFDARTGEMIERRPDPSGKTATSIGPLAPLRRNLEQPDGTCYKYSRGNTRHLIAVIKGESTVVKVLEDYPRDVHIFENLALFTFARAAGEVYAYHLIKDRLVWEFNASKKIKVPEGGYTGISVDGERVLVSTAQTLFALDAYTGEILWLSALPKQNIGRHSAPWTKIARLDDKLVVQCYKDLFLLNAADGRVHWAFDCGPLGEPWPTVRGERLYLSVRGQFRGLEGPESKPLPRRLVNTASRLPSAVVLSREGASYALRFVLRRDLPAVEDVWWSLRPPPPARGNDKYTLVFFREYKNQSTEIDVTEPLSRHGKVNVKYHQKADRVLLRLNGKEILAEPVPRRWPPRDY